MKTLIEGPSKTLLRGEVECGRTECAAGDVTSASGTVRLGWASSWPPEVRSECELIVGAMVPRILVALYIPDRDYRGIRVSVRDIAEELRGRIATLTGGQTKYRHGEGDYRPGDGMAMLEETLAIESFLPTVVTDGLRMHLIDLFVEFGRRALQDVVQIQVGVQGFWIPTRMFRSGEVTNGRANGEVKLTLG